MTHHLTMPHHPDSNGVVHNAKTLYHRSYSMLRRYLRQYPEQVHRLIAHFIIDYTYLKYRFPVSILDENKLFLWLYLYMSSRIPTNDPEFRHIDLGIV